MFRWFRYFGLVVSVVTVVSFRWFRFGVSGFSICRFRIVCDVILRIVDIKLRI